MSLIADYIFVIFLWGLIFVQIFRVVRGTAKWHPNTFAFIFFCAVMITFLVDGIYVWIGSKTGVPDLAWLLSYSSASLTTYFMILWMYDVMKKRVVYGFVLIPIIMITFFCVVFVIGIMPNAENSVPYRDVARTPYELVFMTGFYLSALCLSLVPATQFFHMWRVEKNPALKLHAFSMSVAMWCGVGFLVTRCVYVSAGYFGWFVPEWLNNFAMSFIIAFAISFALFFFPDSWTIYLSTFKRSWQRLRNLRFLRARLHKLTPPVVPSNLIERQRWYDLDFCTYRVIIEILDGKKILSSLLFHNHKLIEGQLVMANNLHVLMSDVDDHLPYEDLVITYSKIGAKLKEEILYDKKNVAIWLSRLVHPFSVLSLALFVGVMLDSNLVMAFLWLVVFLLCLPFPIMTGIWIARQADFLTDLDVSDRKQRSYVYTTSFFLILLALFIFNRFGAPSIASQVIILIISLNLILGMINRWTKVSVHVATSVSCSLLIMLLSVPVGLLFLMASVAVSWSRLYLHHHTPKQVALGWFMAVLITVFVIGIPILV